MTKLLEYSKTYKPFHYAWAVELAEDHEKGHWIHQEVDLSNDVKDWQHNLTPAEKNLFHQIMKLFTQSDAQVAQNYIDYLLPVFKNNEIRQMLLSFAARECFDNKTEVLTSTGWKLFKDLLKTDLVGEFDVNTKEIKFSLPLDYIEKDYVGVLHHYKSTRSDVCVTPNHRLLLINPHTKKTQLTESVKGKWGKNYLYPVNGIVHNENDTLSDFERLLIAIQADGSLKINCPSYITDSSRQNDFSVTLELTKQRKIDRLRLLLTSLGLNAESTIRRNKSHTFHFSLTGLIDVEVFKKIKDFSFFDIKNISSKKANEIIDELVFWDGNSSGTLSYYNTNEIAVDKIQAISCLSDYGCSKGINKKAGVVRILNNKKDSITKTCYRLTFSNENTRSYPHRKEIDYDGKVYCVSMTLGTVITRRNGNVSIQGNCIHQRAYAAILETLNLPDSDFEAFLDYTEMFDKIEFWKLNDTHTLSGKALAITKNIFAEGVSLFGSFVMLLNFQRNEKMLGTNVINRWSILDETQHCDGLIKLFRAFCDEHPKIVTDEFKKTIYDYARQTYDLEERFIDLAFALGDVDKLTKEEVKEYIKYIIDRKLISIGLRGNFGVKVNPLPWIDELLGTKVHENFFETQVTDYQKGGLIGSWDTAW